MSGATPYGSIAHHVPVRPTPTSTSSAMKRTSWRSQISRTCVKYSGRGVEAPVEDPPTGSAMNAATCSAPSCSIASWSTAALHTGNAVHVDEPRAERRFVRLARRGGQGEECAAMVARSEGDDPVLFGPAAFDPVLPRELQRGLDRLGATTKEVELRQVPGDRLGDLCSELFDWFVGKL